jgi:iron-sulfur cluster assembly protein
MISITPEASEHMGKLIADNADTDIKGVRISVLAGGCSGLSYSMDFESEPEMDDNVFGDTPKVFVDSASLELLKGLTLKYEGGLTGKGLVFDNPVAVDTCGCGVSFSIE